MKKKEREITLSNDHKKQKSFYKYINKSAASMKKGQPKISELFHQKKTPINTQMHAVVV